MIIIQLHQQLKADPGVDPVVAEVIRTRVCQVASNVCVYIYIYICIYRERERDVYV